MFRYQDLRGIFSLMNHNDESKNFNRELHLFDNLVAKMSRCKFQQAINQNIFWDSEKVEGGHLEFKDKGNVKPLLGNQLPSC